MDRDELIRRLELAETLPEVRASWHEYREGAGKYPLRQLLAEARQRLTEQSPERVVERCARIADTEAGDVFTRRAPLKSRLAAILCPTRSLRKMARTTRLRVATEIRRTAPRG